MLQPNLFDWRRKSPLRGSAIVFLALIFAFPISHFPNIQRAPLLLLPLFVATIGTADTTRCMQRQWNWYHGGIVLFIYMDLMVVTLILFFLVYPYLIQR